MIGNNIKKIREEKRMTQKVLADKTNLTKRTILNYEAGDRQPKYSTLEDIAKALEVSMTEMVTGEKLLSDGDLETYVCGLTLEINSRETEIKNLDTKIYMLNWDVKWMKELRDNLDELCPDIEVPFEYEESIDEGDVML